MRMTTLNITVDRSKRKATVLGNSDKIFIGDSTVTVNVDGFESDELNELQPYIQILNCNEVCAEAELVNPEQGDGTSLTANLNTNTVQFAKAFNGCCHNVVKSFTIRIFAYAVEEPIALGMVKIANFPLIGNYETPSNIPSASGIIATLRQEISSAESEANKATAAVKAVDDVVVGMKFKVSDVFDMNCSNWAFRQAFAAVWKKLGGTVINEE